MNKKQITTLAVAFVLGIIVLILIVGGFERNDSQNWQFVQSVGGTVTIKDQPGWYLKMFAKVWTYPRYVDKAWNDIEGEGDKALQSIRTTFNDGGQAQVSTYIRYSTPTSEEKRIEFHRQFSGNIDNATVAVKSHLINCVKATGPLMSASENQSARKAEFTQLIEEQLVNGLYQMKRIEKEIQIIADPIDIVPEAALKTPVPKTEIKVTTEVLRDVQGQALVAKKSPLDVYDITVLQFSVTATDYDPEILKQFAAKKTSFLAAEQSKADRAMETAERLAVIEKGLREVAEAQAKGNVEKETAVVAAQLKAEVATQAKLEAETVAEMALSVAEIEKKEAQIRLDQAELDSQAIIVLAKAEQEKIRLAGAITELETAMIEAEVKMKIGIAEAYSGIAVPSTVITSGGMNGDGQVHGGMQDSLMSLVLLKLVGGDMGTFGTINSVDPANRKVLQTAAPVATVTQ